MAHRNPWKTLLLCLLLSAACDFADPVADAPPPAGSSSVTSDPGSSDLGDSDPGDSDPGDSDPGDSDPGDSDPGDSDPGSRDSDGTDVDPPDTDMDTPQAGAPAEADGSQPDGEGGQDADSYPAGPYGFGQGDTVPDVELWDEAGTSVRLSDLRATDGVRVIVWSSGAEWCPICRIQATKLQALHTAKAEEGLFVFESLYQSTNRSPAVPETLGRWKADLGVTYLLLTEPDPNHANHTDNPLELVIDARTMKISYRQQHVTSDLTVHVEAALAQADP